MGSRRGKGLRTKLAAKHMKKLKTSANKIVTKLSDDGSLSDGGRLSTGRKSSGSSFISDLNAFISELSVICNRAHQ